MAGEMRERAAKAVRAASAEWDEPLTIDEATGLTDAVLAVVADVEGIAGVLRAHTSVRLDEEWYCEDCGGEIPPVHHPEDALALHQAEAVAAYLRGAAMTRDGDVLRAAADAMPEDTVSARAWLTARAHELDQAERPEPRDTTEPAQGNVVGPLNPDCAGGKCAACAGDAWDDENDVRTTCACACHQEATP